MTLIKHMHRETRNTENVEDRVRWQGGVAWIF